MDTRTALRRLHLFADVLSPKQLDDFAGRCRPCSFRAGSILMHQGDFGSSMFGILNGEASVTFVDGRDQGRAVAVVSAGEVVGEMAMLTGDRRSATVTALTDVEALEIAKPALEKLFAQSPELIDAFAATLASRKSELDHLAAEHADSARSKFLRQIQKVFGAGIRAEMRRR